MHFRQGAAWFALALALSGCSHTTSSQTEHKDEPSFKFSSKRSPLTGLKQASVPSNPVFYVKIENTNGGEPQYGEHQADMMIEELVEDGNTRCIGLFYSKLPAKVGHVRSARTTDIALSRPTNGIIVASGSAQKTRDEILGRKLPFYTWDWQDGAGWSTDPNKQPPYHVLLNLQSMAGAVKEKPMPVANYFTFGTGPAEEAKKSTRAAVRFSPETTTRWSYTGGTYHRSPERAAPGQEFKADTVVVVFARVTEAGYNDKAGNPVPETVVQGSGRAVILHAGTATEATWNKPKPRSTMTFRTKDGGNAFGLKPGHIWLEAVPRGGSIKY